MDRIKPEISEARDDSPEADPEVAALLNFVPVPRKQERRGGWNGDNQRAFVAGVALGGDANQAAHAVGLTARGAYELCKRAGADGFKQAWDSALALYHRRNPRRIPPLVDAASTAPPAPDAADPKREQADRDEFVETILMKYWLKLEQERIARLAGRIIEADYYVRQLTWFEVMLDLCGKGPELLKGLKRGGHRVLEIVATPISLLLDDVRRASWAEAGEPDRPMLPSLGRHDGEVSMGEPMECQYYRERDGDEKEHRRRQEETQALRAEAQRLWEEKARADAEEWAKRLKGESGAGGEEADGEPDAEPQP